MIKKERLQTLIKQEATIYCVFDDCITNFTLNKKYKFTGDKDTLFQNGDCSCYIKNLYETKEEAEFVAKNYDTRIEKFEPPFVLPLYERYEFMSKYLGNVFVNHNEDCYYVCASGFYAMHYFDTYQEAVDYARKLFNGEE